MTIYEYSIINDFPNQDINCKNLHEAIEKSNIVSLLDGITYENDNVIISFETTLSTEDKTTLDNIVSNHDSDVHLFRVNLQKNVDINSDINFQGLYKEEVIDYKGSLIEKNYYTTFDGTSFSGLAIKDEMSYYLLPNDLVLYRSEKISWYLTNGEVGVEKVLPNKYYIIAGNPMDAIKEGMRRRTNLIDRAKAYGLGAIQGTRDVTGETPMPNSHYFFQIITEEVEKYINGTCKECLLDRFENAEEEYITPTIKATIIGILEYWGTGA